MGAIINDFTVEQLKYKIVAGSVNNQLAELRHGDMLVERGILYIPDYVINSERVINIYEEIKGYNSERAMSRFSNIFNIVKQIVETSKKENIPTYKAADRMAEQRIEKNGKVKLKYLGK